MWFGLFLVLIAIPLLELALLIKLGQSIGVFATFAVLLISAGAGLMIMQAQGFAALGRASQSMREGKPPVEPVVDSFMLMLAGGLLLVPGLITDVVGLLLLIPPVRHLVAAWGLRRLFSSAEVHVATWSTTSERTTRPSDDRPGRGASGGTVIEGEFERLDEKPASGRRSDDQAGKPYRNGAAKEP